MTADNQIEILLVEDNPDEALLITRALRKSIPATHLFHVHDGVEATDFLFSLGRFGNRKTGSTPKLIILDLKMPRMDGHDVLRIIKTDERTKAIPVVMMTTSRDERDILISYALGVNSYIIKPTSLETINSTASEIGHYWLKLNNAVG